MVASFYYFVRCCYINSFVEFNLDSKRTEASFHIVRQTATAEVCHLFTASGAKGTGWVVNGNQQTGNIQGNGNEKLNKQPVNRARK